MIKDNLFFGFVAITFLTGILIISKFVIPNYLPVIYLFILFPFYIWKCFKLIFKSSSYIKKTYPSFYEKHKSLTNSVDGKIVYLGRAEVDRLNDEVVKNYQSKIFNLVALIALNFLFFMFFCVLVVLMN